MRILITGAGGRIGSAAATLLHESGHDVVATDTVYRAQLPFKLHLADLCDTHAVYPLIEGCDAVIHLGNHPHPWSIRPPQTLLAQNVAMNTNVFVAALDVGVRRIVAISSIQATLGMDASKMHRGELPPCAWPYLPADGQLPRNPGNNLYALSKVFAEQTLEAMAGEHHDLSAVAVRFPWVRKSIDDPRVQSQRPLRVDDRRLNDGMCSISEADASSSLRAIVEQASPGYRQYFVAQSLAIKGMTHEQVAAKFYPQQRITGPFTAEGGLVDLSALKDECGWSPAEPLIELELDPDDFPG